MYTGPIRAEVCFLDRINRYLITHTDVLAASILAVAFLPRLFEAWGTYLNPDEANYFTMSLPDRFLDLYRSALRTHHPPLYIILMHYIGKITVSDLSLRMVSLITGTIFPWFVYRWLSLTWSKVAGLLALVILAFAPHLVSLSAQARGYSLAFLTMAMSLYFLERAIEGSSVGWMAAAAAALYVAIFSEYFVVFFCAGAAAYFIARVWGGSPPRRLLYTWGAAQAGGVLLYVYHYVTHISWMSNSESSEWSLTGWLRGAFPWPGDNPVMYAALSTMKQFAYLFASIPVGALMVLPFLAGLVFLYRGRSPQERQLSRSMIVLFLIPWLLAAAAAFAHLHPYGRSRHTVFLGIFIASGIAVGLEKVVRARPWILVPLLAVAIAVWGPAREEDQNNLLAARHRKEDMLAAVRLMREKIPADSLVLGDSETIRLVDFYLGPGRDGWAHRNAAVEWPNYFRLVRYRYSYGDLSEVIGDLRRLRQEYPIGDDESVWFVEGGWDLLEYRHHPRGDMFERGILDKFSNALWVVRTPPELVADER